MSKYFIAIFFGVTFLIFGAISVLSYPSPTTATPLTGTIQPPTPIVTPTPGAPYISLIPNCGQGPTVQLTIQGFNWDNNEDISVLWNKNVITNISAGHGGYFSITRIFDTIDGIYEIRAESIASSANKDIATAEFHNPCAEKIEPPSQGIDIITDKNTVQGIANRTFQTIQGPRICIYYGDPYSPWNSPWKPGSYTYRYKIEIPADYPSDIVRVELFDPDSINNAETAATVQRTDAAVIAGLSPMATKDCLSGRANQMNPCLLPTDETDASGTPVGGLTGNEVNPYWLIRVDDHLGSGAAPGNGQCGKPAVYKPLYNTNTLFQLYYYSQGVGNIPHRQELANYTGQTGDGIRDNGDHGTDLHWVAPGAEMSFGSDFDKPGIDVPVDPGSATSFEIDLTKEVPQMLVGPQTGNRYLYLDVTALEGSSANAFAIWAGPPDDVAATPSEVNQRNIYLLNNPTSHHSGGIKIYTLDYLPLLSEGRYQIEVPLIELQADDAGKVFSISLFDVDAGAGPPPVTFFFDSISETEWSPSFGSISRDGIDPDGIPDYVRCQLGSCNGLWINPPYHIRIPNNFIEGTLKARFSNGDGDKYGFEIKELGSKASCLSYPIAVTADIIPTNAQPGTSIQVHRSDGFDWLSWNVGITATVQTLVDSLTPPGNIEDYVNHGDAGAGLFGFPYVFRGYADPTEELDVELQIDDWIATNPSDVTAADIGAIFDAYIVTKRPLHLPISGQKVGNNHQVTAFANFKLLDYDLDAAYPWLMLEFLGEDVSCGQTAVSPASVQIDGITIGEPNSTYNIMATVSSEFTTQPITYTWQIDNQPPFTQTNALFDVINTSWADLGIHTIAVTAENETGTAVTDTHTIAILEPKIYLPVVIKD